MIAKSSIKRPKQIEPNFDIQLSFTRVSVAAVVVACVTALFAGSLSATTLSLPAQSVTRTTALEYHPTTGLLLKRIDEPAGTSDLKLETSYGYTSQGAKASEGALGWDGTKDVTRATATGWGADGRFPSSHTNAVGQIERIEYDPRWGLVSKRVDPRGWMTRWEYDGFGRKVAERRGYASESATSFTDLTTWDYQACGGDCPSVGGVAARMVVVEVVKSASGAQIGAQIRHFLNEVGKEIRVETQVLTSPGVVGLSYRDTVYDERGNPLRVSQPYFSGETPTWTVAEYDALNRKVNETSPRGTLTDLPYVGLTSSSAVTVSGRVRTNSVETNAQGQTIRVTDALGSSVGYLYDASGQLARTVSPYGDVVQLGYDARGRKVDQVDPDVGHWTYVVNAFGETVRQTNELGKTTTFTYDPAGRVLTRAEGDLNSTFVYDDGANGTGRLIKTSSDNGYCRVHAYDEFSRPTTTTVRLGTGASACDQYSDQLITSIGYDAFGRTASQTYPTGFKVRIVRDELIGEPTQLLNDRTGSLYWQRGSTDAASRLTSYSYGNKVQTNLTYDDQKMGWLKKISSGLAVAPTSIQYSEYQRNDVGQVSERSDTFDLPNGLIESLESDVLGRVSSYFRKNFDGSEVAGSRIDVRYDAVGRIISKSDTGKYFYSQPDGRRPHAVTSVEGALYATYGYDALGQMVVRSGVSQFYTDAGLLRMTGGQSACHEFLYQGEGMRVRQSIYGSACVVSGGALANPESSLIAQTIYVHPDVSNGLSFEREFKKREGIFNKHYLTVAGQVVGMVLTDELGGELAVDYMHYDHLGSVVAVTDATGAVVERRSFDAWGRPRATTGVQGEGAELPNGMLAVTDRGFTLHEHLEGVGLIHMNGRAYDPIIGRFTSADSVVGSPLNLQSYDRYAYVLNQPLELTDPTGNFPEMPSFDWSFGASGNSQTANAGMAIYLSYGWGGAPANNGQTGAGPSMNTGMGAGPTALPKYDGYQSQESRTGLGARIDGLLDAADKRLAFTRDALVAAVPVVGERMYESGVGQDIKFLDPFQAVTDGTRAARNGDYRGAALAGVGLLFKPVRGLKDGVKISEKGLSLVEANLARFERYAPNEAMVARLKESLKSGDKLFGADANFYLHEIAEGTARARGLSYDAAHAAALEKYGVSNFAIYAKEVVEKFPSEFNGAWRKFWNIK